MGRWLVFRRARNPWALSSFFAGDPFHHDRFGDPLLQKPDGPAFPRVSKEPLPSILRTGGGLAKEDQRLAEEE